MLAFQSVIFLSISVLAGTAVLEVPQEFLRMSLTEYEVEIERYCKQLRSVTNLSWKYNGTCLASEWFSAHHPEEPEHPNIYKNKIIDILISRQILCDANQGTEKIFRGITKPDVRYCQVIDPERLFTIDGEKLYEEIKLASQLIGDITGKQCRCLHLHPVSDGEYYKVLEKIGCITVPGYSGACQGK